MYFDKCLFPVTPEKISIKINGNNKTVNLINEGEINILKKAGLTDIEFEAEIPQVKHPYAVYKNGFKEAGYFFDIFEGLKTGKKTFQFIVCRKTPVGKKLLNTNMKVSLEDYKISEDAKNGFDFKVKFNLKQYRDYGTKTVNIKIAASKPKASAEPKRETNNSPAPAAAQTYTVVRGDCLWKIAKRFYGSGAKYTVIYNAKVKGIEGVGSCKVKRVWNGDIRPADMIVSTVVKNWYESIISTVPAAVKPWLDAVYNAAKDKKLTVGGTVHVVITDSDDYGEASSTLVQYVQQTLDPEENAGEGYGLAPIGHVVSVASASPVSIEVKTTVTFEEGHNWSNTKAAIAEAVDAYFLELRKNWSETSQTIVRVSQIENRILGVDGVVDVTGTKLNGTASNMTLTEFCIPKLGGVSA